MSNFRAIIILFCSKVHECLHVTFNLIKEHHSVCFPAPKRQFLYFFLCFSFADSIFCPCFSQKEAKHKPTGENTKRCSVTKLKAT